MGACDLPLFQLVSRRSHIQISPIAFGENVPTHTSAIPCSETVSVCSELAAHIAQTSVVVISDRGLKEGQLEYQHRRDAAATKVAAADVFGFVKGRLQA